MVLIILGDAVYAWKNRSRHHGSKIALEESDI
jgi:hypothetical protein